MIRIRSDDYSQGPELGPFFMLQPTKKPAVLPVRIPDGDAPSEGVERI